MYREREREKIGSESIGSSYNIGGGGIVNVRTPLFTPLIEI